ncbi:hypothetical protein GAYE_FCTG49G0079 [Galdieria yellowstonensis]|uniref:Amino acid transporter transmembrane domain-containing protein n=1 Tax=Galdieria yellowstonensis TaxID=3028027 RepID=A0AAV9I7T0_9RHOD|nr:hypothetical protein GAYE_FCTG49G0079 [Galdieria yellowstonensis]
MDSSEQIREDIQGKEVSGVTQAYSDEVTVNTLEAGEKRDSLAEQGAVRTVIDGTLRRPHMGWWRCVFLILGDILGTGILAIPSGLASMGWVLGLLFLFVMCAVFIYCGILLAKMRLIFPYIRTYGDLGEAVFGFWGRWAVYLVQYSNMYLALPVYLLVASTALREAVSPGSCLIIWMFVNSGIVLCLLQTRTLKFMTWYSVVGTACIVVTLMISIVQICIDAHTSTTHGQVVSSSGFENGLVGSGDIIFAYSGIYMFIEFMDEMKRPRDFPKAVYTANLLLLFSYGFVGILGYAVYGLPVVNPITSSLSAGKVKRVANGFLWIHVLVSYLVTGLVFNRAVAVRFVRKFVDDFSLKGIAAWFVVTLASTGLTLLLNIFFPYLSDIESLLGTLFSPITGFIYPPLFYWKCAGSKMSWKHKIVATFVILVFGVAYTVLGTYGTIYSIVQNVGATPLLYKCLYKK